MPVRAEPMRRADAKVVAIWTAISSTLDDSWASSRDGISIPTVPTARLNQSIRLGHRLSGIQKAHAYSRTRMKKINEVGVGLTQSPMPSALTRVSTQVWKKPRRIGGEYRKLRQNRVPTAASCIA